MSASEWKNLDGMPLEGDEPVFEEPWQAQAFAMAVTLNEQNVFSWNEWAQMLGTNIAAEPGDPYWSRWLATLEDMMLRQNITDEDAIERRTQHWQEAAARTPHGQPIELEGGHDGNQP